MSIKNIKNKKMSSYLDKSLDSNKKHKVMFTHNTYVEGKVYGPEHGRVELSERTVKELKKSSFAKKNTILFNK